MKKCLVTGGAGFIGSHLVDKLIEQGNEVIIIDNLVSGKKEYINPRAKFFEMDICSDRVAGVFASEKIDWVFHLAAQIDIKTSMEKPRFDNEVNALGSFNIFEASAKNKVEKIVFVSTGGALYGDCEKPATEKTLIEPGSPYAIHKYTAERYLEVIKELYNTDYAVLRLANVYGPRQYKGGECGVISIFTGNHFNKQESLLFGDGSKTRDYVYVHDVVEACLSVARKNMGGVFNIGSETETNNLEIIKEIERATEEKFNFKFVPDKPGEVFRSCLSYQKAKKELAWEPKVDLREGIERTFEWLRKQI